MINTGHLNKKMEVTKPRRKRPYNKNSKLSSKASSYLSIYYKKIAKAPDFKDTYTTPKEHHHRPSATSIRTEAQMKKTDRKLKDIQRQLKENQLL
jgi:hypothetical protein